MTRPVHRVEYGSASIEYEVQRSDRATLEINVEPDGGVRVVAPLAVELDEITERVLKRASWIRKQQSYFAQFRPRTPDRQFLPGETHLYLGRQYRLRVLPGDVKQAKLVRGFILVSGVEFNDTRTIERLVTAWFRERADAQFDRRLQMNRNRFSNPDDFSPTSIRIQRMVSQWGSMSPGGRLLLHPDLVRAPVDAIDYVITHELCHLAVPNHSRAFFELQEKVMPDWERRKARLERIMA